MTLLGLGIAALVAIAFIAFLGFMDKVAKRGENSKL